VYKIKKKQSAITSKRYEIGCQLLLTTNRKSHTVFRLVPISVTLNDLERRNRALILRYFAEFDSFTGLLRHSGWRLFAEYRLPLLAKTDPPCSAVSLR